MKDEKLSRPVFAKKRLEQCIRKYRGDMSLIQEALETSRIKVHLGIEYYKLHDLIDEQRERIKDLAERALFKKIEDQTASDKLLIDFLDRQARERGYGSKQEIEHSGEVSIPVSRWAED